MSSLSSQSASRRVYVLGGLRVESDGEPVHVRGHKMKGLFAYLILHPQLPQRRERLADLLWPEADPARVRRNLSDVLYRLRRALGPGWLQVEQDRVALQQGEGLWVDVWSFEQLAQTGDTADLAEAVALYSGDLLPELYDDWLLERRVALRETYLSCLLRLGKTAEQHNQHQKAYSYYHTLTHADPLREEAHRGLMRALAAMDRLAEALSAYTKLERLLADELGVPPAEQTQTLMARLRSELELKAAVRDRLVRPPFVGRVRERAQLLARLDQAAEGAGGMVAILGDAGIGKTHLLQELAQAANWRGWQVAWGNGQEFTHPPAHTPLRQALAAALPRPRLRQLSQLVPPLWLTIAAHIVPHINEHLNQSPPQSGPTQQQSLPAAIRHLWRGLEQIAPHLFILDDVHWGDTAVWSLLDNLRPALTEMAVLVVVSGRTDELRNNELAWSRLKAWDQAGQPIIQLAGLESEDLEALAKARHGDDVRADRLNRLRHMSGGNPLLALTLLDSDDWDSLPDDPSLVDQLLRRLEAVSETARTALQAAAVIGFQFDYSLWEALASSAVDVPTADLPTLAGELERARLILLESEGYRFAHDTLRACVYTHIPPRQRQHLHQHALTTFRQYRPGDILDLLHHAEQAGDQEAIARYALPAGQQALRHFTYQPAVDYFSRVLQALPADDWAGRYAAVLGRVQALDVLARRDRQQADLDLLQQLAEKLDDDGRHAEVAYYRANFYWATGAYTQALATAEAGLGQARRIDDLKQRALLLEIMGRSARDLGHYAQANEWFMEARACYTQLGNERGAAWIDGMLGLVAQRQGRLQEAIAYHTRAMNAHRQIGDPFNEMRAASGLAIALWMAGDYGQARSIFEHTLHLSREVEDHRMEEASLANLGGLADVLADYTTAIELKEQALALSRASDNKMGVALGLCNLGITYYKLGYLEQSLAAFDEAVAIDRQTGRRQGEAYSLHSRGVTLFEMGRVAEARRSLEEARAIRTELAERDVLIATEADLALVALAEEELEQALASLETTLTSLQDDDRADLREQVYYAAYRVTAAHGDRTMATEHLRRAEAAMMELADALPPEARQRFLQQDPLNRKVQAALDALMHKVQVRLVRADVPLGRKLTEADYTQVTWTLHAPEDDAFTGAAERRRHVLKRLLAEAEAQGAVPTDDDLAQALDVSRRTIVRDMKTLAQAGHPLPTRRRAAD